MSKFTKVVITAAGRGTRFLPITKVIPKELLPIGNQPSLYYLLKECKDSGVTDVAIVLRDRGNLIEQYYSKDQQLEEYLRSVGKDQLIQEIAAADLDLNLSFFEQPKNLPYGNGTPLFAVRDWVGTDNFALMFGDDMFISPTPALQQLNEAWDGQPDFRAILGTVESTEEEIIGKLGVVTPMSGAQKPVMPVDGFVEKPTKEEMLSREALIGRAAFSADIFKALDEVLATKPADRELFLWDAAFRLRGDTYESNKLGFVRLQGRWRTTGTPQLMAVAAKELLGY